MEERNLNFEEFIKTFYDKYIVDENNVSVIKKVSLWANRDASFEDRKLGHHLDKGLLIMGDVGTGKTDLFRLLRIYLKDYKKSNYAFDYSVVWELTADFNEKGFPALKPHEVKNMYYDELCLTNERTDFPEKERAIHFGQKLLIGEELILTRYNSFKGCGYQTHFTTNASLDELLKVYGDRPYSRLQEMCNFLILTGEDKRAVSNPNLYRNVNSDVKAKPKEVSPEEIRENKVLLDESYKKFIELGELDAITIYTNYLLLRSYNCDIGDEETMKGYMDIVSKNYSQSLDVMRKTESEKTKDRENYISLEAKKLAVVKFYQKLKEAGSKTIFGLVSIELGLPDSDRNKIGQIDVSEKVKIEKA